MSDDLKLYELWFSEEDGYSFFETSNEAARRLLTPDAKLIWSVRAANFYDAQSLKHKHLGWEPYVPPHFPENESPPKW